jgi:hypothetical protein
MPDWWLVRKPESSYLHAFAMMPLASLVHFWLKNIASQSIIKHVTACGKSCSSWHFGADNGYNFTNGGYAASVCDYREDPAACSMPQFDDEGQPAM